MKPAHRIAALALPLLVAACTTVPTGPGVMVLPSSGKSFAQFRADDIECRNFAFESVGRQTASQAASDSGVKSAVVGTAVGAASSYELQHRYDISYIQCMYALGHKVPVSGRVYRYQRSAPYQPPALPAGIPPPPPGSPPPPPQGVNPP